MLIIANKNENTSYNVILCYNIYMLRVDTLKQSTFFDNALRNELVNEITDLRTVEITASTRIGYLLLNKHLLGEASPIVSVGGFMSDLTTPDRAWEGVNLASLQRPVLMLDMPGHGLSTPHNRKQITDLCISRSADSQAEPLVDAVQKLLNPEDEIDYFGVSHGGLLGLKMTEKDPGDRVITVFGLDIPAVKRRTTVGLQAGYLVSDNLIGRRKYLKALKGTSQEADYERFKREHELLGIKQAPSFVKNNPGLFILNLISSINASPVALDSWKNIMASKSSSVRITTSASGSVSDPKAIEEFINKLPQNHQLRSSQIIVDGEDHNIGIVHLMPRAVEWAQEAYAA